MTGRGSAFSVFRGVPGEHLAIKKYILFLHPYLHTDTKSNTTLLQNLLTVCWGIGQKKIADASAEVEPIFAVQNLFGMQCSMHIGMFFCVAQVVPFIQIRSIEND